MPKDDKTERKKVAVYFTVENESIAKELMWIHLGIQYPYLPYAMYVGGTSLLILRLPREGEDIAVCTIYIDFIHVWENI